MPLPRFAGLFLGLFALASACPALAIDSSVTLSPRAGLSLLPGPYQWEAGVDLAVQFSPDPLWQPALGLSYSTLPLGPSLAPLNLVTATVGAGVTLWRQGPFRVVPVVSVGGFGAFHEGSTPLWNPLVGAGLRLGLALPGLDLALEPDARVLWAQQKGQPHVFLATAGVKVSLGLDLGGSAATSHQPLLRLEDPRFDPAFPTLYKSYENTPLGRVSVVNGEQDGVSDVVVRFLVKSYMDQPQVIGRVATLAPGARLPLSVTALMKNSVLGITETDTAQSQLTVSYRWRGQSLSTSWEGSLRLEGRNAIVWDDDSKAAAFVTAKDPSVLKLARNAVVRLAEGTPSVPSTAFRQSAVLFRALAAYGLRYVVDPSGSYATVKDRSQAVDFLQFPIETLTYRTGDCDDLSTLFNALLEAVGIEAAFITVPGHIFVAAALDVAPEAVGATFAHPEDLIVRDGRVWLPLEITALGKGFTQAWKLAAREWREGSASGAARLIPLHEAWATYEPSFLSSAERAEVVEQFPRFDVVGAQAGDELQVLADEQLAVLTKQARSESGLAEGRKSNKLGVLYARFGRPLDAETWFRRAVDQGWSAALLNLGNLAWLRGDYQSSSELYQRAVALGTEASRWTYLTSSPLPDSTGSGRAANTSVAPVLWNQP